MVAVTARKKRSCSMNQTIAAERSSRRYRGTIVRAIRRHLSMADPNPVAIAAMRTIAFHDCEAPAL